MDRGVPGAQRVIGAARDTDCFYAADIIIRMKDPQVLRVKEKLQ
ncbi:hypothetical protein ABIC90_001013 [Variovorax boronicumulans]